VYVIKAGSISLYGIQKKLASIIPEQIGWLQNGRTNQSVTHPFRHILISFNLYVSTFCPFQGPPGNDCLLIFWILKILAEQNALASLLLKTYPFAKTALILYALLFFTPYCLTVACRLERKVSLGRSGNLEVLFSN